MLFLHGYLSNGKSFYRQQNYLSRDFEVFAPDLKGFGDNANMEFPYSLNDYISELREYMYKHSLEAPHVVAHSFGARIALKAAFYDKILFDKLVLTGAAGLKPRFSIRKTVKKTAFSILKTFFPKEKLVAFYSPDYVNLSPVMKESFKLIVSEHLDYTLKGIKNPTLLIFGDRDKETPLYFARRLHNDIKDARLVILENAGHFAFLDKPFQFNTEVREFLLS